ncbi:putative protein FAM47D [Nannospalax galili]|uniref:putative protein FAM47D n=1 Tax=Nannospalax galili TaxID=1026970 RepID=UPI00081A1006|nr:putative protein FAM47D [Nannospalax galili]
MGDQSLRENQQRQTAGYKTQLPSKCVLKHKEEQVKFPSLLESQRQQFLREELEVFGRDCSLSEGLLSHTIQGTFFPRISHTVSSTATTKSQHAVDPSFHMEDGSADSSLLQVPKYNHKLNNKWPFGGKSEGNKKHSTRGKLPQRKSNLALPKGPGSIQGSWLSEGAHQNQDLLDSLYYTHMQSRSGDLSECDETFGELDVVEQLEMEDGCQLSHEDSLDKKIGLWPCGLKHLSALGKAEDIRPSKQETNSGMKGRQWHGPPKPTKEKIKYRPSNQKDKQSKTRKNSESVAEPKILLEIEGRNFCQPDILEDLYGTIAFKDFIVSKGYGTPGILKKLFVRKGWDYASVS